MAKSDDHAFTCSCGRVWSVRAASRAIKSDRDDSVSTDQKTFFRLCSCGLEFSVVVSTKCFLCGKPPRENGLCTGHAAQKKRKKEFSVLARKYLDQSDKRPAMERFFELTTPEPTTGCLLWLGSVSPDGYGRFPAADGSRYAHRAALIFKEGPPPFKGACALHACDTPACVNADHLRWGTKKENRDDAVRRGRAFLPKRRNYTES